MAAFVEQSPTEIQQQYKKRVDDFFQQVKTWLPAHFTPVMTTKNLIDETGDCSVNMLSIILKEGSVLDDEPDYTVDIFPMSAKTLLSDGLLELAGPLGNENLYFFSPTTLQQIPLKTGGIKPIYQGINTDGWYWFEEVSSEQALLLDAELFLWLVNQVSFYDIN